MNQALIPYIVVAYPPNIEAIRRVLKVPKGAIFTYGNTIYNPDGGKIPPWLLQHEQTHRHQQGEDVEGWWKQYLSNPAFRFEQELEAHRVEWRAYVGHGFGRNERRVYLKEIAARLASRMYGNLVSEAEAKHMISK